MTDGTGSDSELEGIFSAPDNAFCDLTIVNLSRFLVP